MDPDHPEISEFRKPALLVFLVWVTRQHTDALVTLCVKLKHVLGLI